MPSVYAKLSFHMRGFAMRTTHFIIIGLALLFWYSKKGEGTEDPGGRGKGHSGRTAPTPPGKPDDDIEE